MLSTMRALAAAVAVLAAGAACARSENGAEAPPRIDCHVFYRASVTRPLGREVPLRLEPAPQPRRVSFADLAFEARYTSDRFEGTSLTISVSQPDQPDAVLVRELYQLPADAPPQNDFLGSHGFTGLVYAYHPTSGAELQFYCAVAEGG